MIPHTDKTSSGGADALFYSRKALGVADGVGEWEWRFKINPRRFAEHVMNGCFRASERISSLPGFDRMTPLEIVSKVLEIGFGEATAFGSSTAITAILDRSGSKLAVANVGDSGLIHLRKDTLPNGRLAMTHVLRTKEQQHIFNMPYQLSHLPQPSEFDRLERDPELTHFIREMRQLQNKELRKPDFPSDAELYCSSLKEGDLLISYSDGVSDNIWSFDLVRMIQDCWSPFDAEAMREEALPGEEAKPPMFSDPEAMARFIAERAHKCSLIT